MTYIAFIENEIRKIPVGIPIYTSKLSSELAANYNLNFNDASAATSVAIKRIIDSNLIDELRFYQKGIYYRTSVTPFGEVKIDRQCLIEDKYLQPDKGYETGISFLNRIGLTTQIPRDETIATNMAKDCSRIDKRLGVVIKPPKTTINSDNINYLQILDALELIDNTPVDVDNPFEIIAKYIKEQGLKYEKLLYIADCYYNKKTIIQLAHTAGQGGYLI